jgi:hypothetical protein
MRGQLVFSSRQNNLSDERTEFLINDRLSFMRFLGPSLGERVPDAKMIARVFGGVQFPSIVL